MSDTPFKSTDADQPRPAKTAAAEDRSTSGECCQADAAGSQLGTGPAFSLLGLFLLLGSLAILFAVLRAISMPDMERWFIFAASFALVAGWWVISVGSAQRRQQAAVCSSHQPESLADRRARAEFSDAILAFSKKMNCSPEGAHFLTDAIYFAPNYFEEAESTEGRRVLTADQLLVAVVRYAQECFHDEAGLRMSNWGLDTRDRLRFVIAELTAHNLTQLGTRGYELESQEKTL